MNRERLLDLGMVTVVACTLLMTGMALRAQFSPSVGERFTGRQPPELLEDWKSLAERGHRIGPDDAECGI